MEAVLSEEKEKADEMSPGGLDCSSQVETGICQKEPWSSGTRRICHGPMHRKAREPEKQLL